MSENTGLPCPDCGKKQERVSVWWNGDELLVRMSVSIERSKVAKEIKGLCSLLKMFAQG